MNTNQKQGVLNAISAIQQADLALIINELHPNVADANQIMIGNHTAPAFVQLFERMLRQFKNELENGLGLLLPNYQNLSNDFGEVRLDQDFTNLQRWFAEKDLLSITNRLEALISYAVIQGFWQSTTTVENDKDKYSKLVSELTVVEKKLSSFIDTNQRLVDELNSSKESLNRFMEEKRQDFITLSENQNASNLTLQNVNDIHNKVSELSINMNNIYENQKTRISDIDGEFSIIKDKYETLNTEINENSTTLKNTIKEGKQAQEYIQSSKAAIEERMTEARRLLGLSADAALGGKFSLRESKVSKSLIWWRIAVAVSVAVAVAWSVVVFKRLRTDTSLPYLDILVNLVKTSPGFLLMGYIMAQYNKERAIEEEYAFRAAIAETINAYADLLGDSDKKENTSRQTMLLDAIKQVYNKPQMYKEPSKSIINKSSVRELSEIIKNVKG